LTKPLKTVDMVSKEAASAFKERADVCAVPAAGVVGEAMIAIVLASATLEKFGCDCLEDVLSNYHGYLERINKL
jgi:chorismate synthase